MSAYNRVMLDHDRCYDALKSRDARFDGRFYVGVKTTGIYCRPVCPARTPKRENITFYPCAAAAEEAGFRPCLRCRPETSPGTPAWLGSPATVSRALRLIEGGALDNGSVEELAGKLGVGGRHLRRLFLKHLGATPVAVAQTRRLHSAKRLLHDTDLAITAVAFQAGFGSLRRFNAAFQEAYRLSPTAIRRAKGSRAGGKPFALRLHYRPPFNWAALLGFLGERAIVGVEQVTPDWYRRTVRAGNATGIIEITHDAGRNCVVLHVPHALSAHAASFVEPARRLFDLTADPRVIAEHLERDARLSPASRAWPGLRVPGAWDPFEMAVRGILGQQISVKAARTLAGRLVETCGERLAQIDGALTHVFPRAEQLAEAPLVGIGVTKKRAETIRVFARAVATGEVQLGAASTLEAAVEALEALPGIGPWSAHYIALRAMGEPDAFPVGDLALLRAAAPEGSGALSQRELLAVAEAWRPWRAYAAVYLWMMYHAQLEGTWESKGATAI